MLLSSACTLLSRSVIASRSAASASALLSNGPTRTWRRLTSGPGGASYRPYHLPCLLFLASSGQLLPRSLPGLGLPSGPGVEGPRQWQAR
jgi:hypothetical protein